MRIDILTLFPEMCEKVCSESIIGRARSAGKVEIVCIGNENTEALLNEQKGFLIALLNRILELKKNETN